MWWMEGSWRNQKNVPTGCESPFLFSTYIWFHIDSLLFVKRFLSLLIVKDVRADYFCACLLRTMRVVWHMIHGAGAARHKRVYTLHLDFTFLNGRQPLAIFLGQLSTFLFKFSPV